MDPEKHKVDTNTIDNTKKTLKVKKVKFKKAKLSSDPTLYLPFMKRVKRRHRNNQIAKLSRKKNRK